MITKIQDARSASGFRTVNLSRQKAIKEKCFNCSGYSRSEAKNCSITTCTLHPFRNGRGELTPDQRNRAIREFCKDDCCEGGDYPVSQCPSPDCPLYAFRLSKIDRSVEVKAPSRPERQQQETRQKDKKDLTADSTDVSRSPRQLSFLDMSGLKQDHQSSDHQSS